MTRHRRRPDRLGDAVRRLARHRWTGRATPPAPAGEIALRVAELERQLQEVRTRINALFFAVLAAALGDLAGRLVLG
jgi:HAMP domain-containing protein